jgi:hypothetical protein
MPETTRTRLTDETIKPDMKVIFVPPFGAKRDLHGTIIKRLGESHGCQWHFAPARREHDWFGVLASECIEDTEG